MDELYPPNHSIGVNTMSFNPELFLDIQTTIANDVRRKPFPEGDHKFLAIKNLEAKSTKNPSYVSVILTFAMEKTEPLKAIYGDREEITLTARINLEVDENYAIKAGPNTNIEFGQLRAALNLNTPGTPFAPRMLIGQGPGRLHVAHRPNEKDPLSPLVDVDRFTKA